eukprot:TRINITY_DN3848_c0_g1_i14.p2 TRINITY_DN3848_c0_g1~~TRINITY_DN3848_c0_g1_i14.p2  ORF type:complete len:136 (-),score=38.01 TRINITY_DN3848_c0_g1_i14:361-768(-)
MQGSHSDVCTVCHRFYGSPQNGGMCSGCYKEHLAKLLGPQATGQSVQPEKKNEDAKEIKGSQVVPQGPKQEDTTRCWKCNIRVGYLGYPCKCGYTYCGKHRYFDTHDCTYDYKAEGKEKIVKANPTVAADKLQKL